MFNQIMRAVTYITLLLSGSIFSMTITVIQYRGDVVLEDKALFVLSWLAITLAITGVLSHIYGIPKMLLLKVVTIGFLLGIMSDIFLPISFFMIVVPWGLLLYQILIGILTTDWLYILLFKKERKLL